MPTLSSNGASPSEIPDLIEDWAAGPLSLEQYSAYSMEGYRIHPVSFLLRPNMGISGALYVPENANGVGVLVAHGHFGEGKSGAEAQAIAHRLAASGVLVLAVDTPGVEERSTPKHWIHEAEGAHNRGWLLAGGSNAMSLQISFLRRGMDVLESQGVSRIGVTGASGGAVQAFYLSLVDERVQALVMASSPRIPREARASGCPCDQIPGRPGPEPGVLANLKVPSLWLSEVPQERPEGLPQHVHFEVIEGPHGYARDMQKRALAFFSESLDFRLEDWKDGDLDLVDLRTPGTLGTSNGIVDLPLTVTQFWEPKPWSNVAYEYDGCSGSGDVVALVGGSNADREILLEEGFRVCQIELPVDELGAVEAIGRGQVYADRQAGGLARAVQKSGAVAIWSVRGWSLPASTVGVPYVIREPLRFMADVKPDQDPVWIHVPGAWWGVLERVNEQAVMAGPDPSALANALSFAIRGQALPISVESATGGPGENRDGRETVQATGDQ